MTPVSRGELVLGRYLGDEDAVHDVIDEKVEGWTKCLRGVIGAGKEDPHCLYQE